MRPKINDEIDLVELFLSLWKYKLIITVIVVFSTVVSFILLKSTFDKKERYETIIKYEINLSLPTQFNYNHYDDLSKKILTRFFKENYNINLIFIKNYQIKVITNDEFKFEYILKKANNEITNTILNKIILETNYLAKIYNQIEGKAENDQKYIDNLVLKEYLDDGHKFFNFYNVRAIKIKFNYHKLILYSIILSLLIGMIFKSGDLIHKKFYRISSKKK